MRIMAMAMVLIFFSSLFTGCIGQEEKDSSEPEEVDGSQTLAFNTNFRDSIIGNLSGPDIIKTCHILGKSLTLDRVVNLKKFIKNNSL